ncbi:DedA family protein, partial [Micromonospora echinofusca]|nr:DedA family protein [Micromonospora echinofusca]
GVVLVAGARLYLGFNLASETVGAVLLGVAWTAVFMVAWATRDRAVGDAPPVAPVPVSPGVPAP